MCKAAKAESQGTNIPQIQRSIYAIVHDPCIALRYRQPNGKARSQRDSLVSNAKKNSRLGASKYGLRIRPTMRLSSMFSNCLNARSQIILEDLSRLLMAHHVHQLPLIIYVVLHT